MAFRTIIFFAAAAFYTVPVLRAAPPATRIVIERENRILVSIVLLISASGQNQ